MNINEWNTFGRCPGLKKTKECQERSFSEKKREESPGNENPKAATSGFIVLIHKLSSFQ
jgi:hypothetical protein